MRLRLDAAVAAVRAQSALVPEFGIILGTGLGALAAEIQAATTIPYDALPDFPVPTVETHRGQLVLGTLAGRPVAALQGRFHYYEGYDLVQVTFPVRVLARLGARALVVSNAAGGLDPDFAPGDLMVITDHINLLPGSPLRGPNDESLGPRFVDMYHCYEPDYVARLAQVGRTLGVPLRRGVYVALAGPSLETAAEYQFLRRIGADAVGMSTVPEVIVARHMGLRVAGISVITDLGVPDRLGPADIDQIIAHARAAEPHLARLISEFVRGGA